MNKENSCQKYTLSTPKKWICLWALISTKDTDHIFSRNTQFTVHNLQLNAFFAPQCEQNTVPHIWILLRYHSLERNVDGS